MSLYNKVLDRLIKKDISTSIVESCTGGLISSIFTSKSGISKIYNLGLVTYSNKSKISILGISPTYLNKYGAVSNEVAKAMCKKLNKLTKSDLCISTTGIAGPTGFTKKKPIGLVYIGILYKKKINIYKKIYTGSRTKIQKKTAKTIFDIIDKLI